MGFDWNLSGNRLDFQLMGGEIEFLDNPDLLLFTVYTSRGEPVQPFTQTLARIPVSHDPDIPIGSWSWGIQNLYSLQFLP